MSEVKPKRKERDGAISIGRDEGNRDTIIVWVTDEGTNQGMQMSEWQARRLLGLLSVMLELKLSSKAARQIET